MTAELMLHIPAGINYECTGCGKCCGGWAVPMTENDYERIRSVDWGARLPRLAGKLFRPLRKHEKTGSPYTHAIEEGEDGRCPFLENNLCFIHSQFQSETKPSICQLFPYCFNETPSGIYATVSFVSMGVIHNSGRPLAEQREYLEKKLHDFRSLFPDHHPNWAKLELTGGKPISWEQYLDLEKHIVACLDDATLSMRDRFIAASRYLVSQARGNDLSSAPNETGKGADRDHPVLTESDSLKAIDNHLLMALHKIYFPTRILKPGEYDFNTFRFIRQIIFKGMGAPLSISLAGQSFSIKQLQETDFPERDEAIDNLIYRYFFSRIFAKLYFSAGYGQLSLITGFHHLALLYGLIRLQSRALALSRGVSKVSYVDVVAAVRQLEKRLGETSVGGYAAAVFELLMFSPARIERVLSAS